MLVRIAAATAVLGLGIGLGACSSGDSATTTTTSGTHTTMPQSFQVDTPDGQVSLSLDGNLPPGWPQGFPLPDGTAPAGSGSLGKQDSTVSVGVYTSSESGESTLDFYSQNSSLTTTGRSAVGVGQSFVGKLTLTSPYSGSVTVVSHDGKTYLVVILKGDPSQSTSTTGAGSTSSTTGSGSGSTSTTTTTAAVTPQ